jgi:hypothetical protein
MTQIGKAIEDSVDTLTDVDTAIPTSKAVSNFVNTTIAGEKVLPNPTLIATTVASKGGVFNGDFELGSGSVSSPGWIGSENYGWYGYNSNTATISYDTTVSRFGKQSIKIVSTTAGTSDLAAIYNYIGTTGYSQKYAIPLKPLTKYRVSCSVKTSGVTSTNSKGFIFQFSEATSTLAVVTSHSSTYLSGTNDFTIITLEFTTAATTAYGFFLQTGIVGETGTVWIDNIIGPEEVIEDTTNTSQIPTPLLSTITGVTSVDNIDQSLDSGGAYTNTYALTNAVNEGATHIQTFTPTKNKITKIGIWPVAGGTGVDWTLVIHDASNNVIASNVIAAAFIVTGAMQYFDVPCLWSSGNYHFHLYASATTGTPTCKANTSNDLETASFIQTYAKPTESATIIANGEKIQLSTNEDGLLSGAIVDLDKGKYYYKYTQNFSTNQIEFANNVYSATAGGFPSSTTSQIINGWQNSYGITGGIAITARNFVIKINTILPIKNIMLAISFNNNYSAATLLEYSVDGVNYTTLYTVPANTGAAGTGRTIEFNLPVVGVNTIYYRHSKAAEAGYTATFYGMRIEADLDTSSIPQPLIYPLATNQFTEEVVLPSNATRVYYRTAKFANKNGVVIPHLEFTDGSGVYIKSVPCKIDNTGETNPAINIVIADTIYAQQSGTGSADSTTGYILNDGEYMTFSTATAYAKVTYKVGGGTTSFANITKNRIYLSSNGSANSSTKDPSHQMGVNLWYRVQSVVRAVSDLTEKVNGIAKDVINYTPWQSWTPTIVWSGGTPAYTLDARWKKVDNLIFFNVSFTIIDGQGITQVTITPPSPVRAVQLPYSAWETNNGVISWILVFYRISTGLFETRNMTAITEGKSGNIAFQGFYELPEVK